MSLCDRCYAPGACCKRFKVYTEEGERTFWADEPVKTQIEDKPFRLLEEEGRFTDPETDREYITAWLTCSNLMHNGRCGDYENRPELCRIFEPAADRLCVHYQGAEGTGEGL